MARKRKQSWGALLAMAPFWVLILGAYVGTMIWTVFISLTSSKMLPNTNFVGLAQYRRLFSTDRWNIAVHNIVIFGVLMMSLSLVIGFLACRDAR